MSSTIPKMVDETLVSYEYHYWVSFGQILKVACFRLIFGRFPLIKSQKQNPMVHSVNFWEKTLIFGIWFPYIKRQLDLSGWVTKTNFAFSEHPCIEWLIYDCNFFSNELRPARCYPTSFSLPGGGQPTTEERYKKNKCWQQKNVIKIFHYSFSGKAEKVWRANVDPSLLSGNQKRIW